MSMTTISRIIPPADIPRLGCPSGSAGAGASCGVGNLNSGILRDDVGHARSDQQQRLTIVSTPHERDRLPLKRSDLTVG